MYVAAHCSKTQGPVSSFFKVLLAEDVYISIYTVNAPKTFKKHDTGPCVLKQLQISKQVYVLRFFKMTALTLVHVRTLPLETCVYTAF